MQTPPANDDNEIRIDHYKGADSPTILIMISSESSIRLIRDVFLQLARNEIDEIELHEIQPTKISNLKTLTLRRVPDGKESRQALVRAQVTTEGAVFV
jgi:hypothetical protein